MYSTIEIISQMCWLALLLYSLLSLVAISVSPLLTLLCCWGYWRLPLGLPLLPPHLLPLPENCLFQGFTDEHGTLPCRARGCLHSWSSARWVCPCLTSPVTCCRDALVFLHSSGLVFRLVLAQSATAGVLSWNLLAVLQLCRSGTHKKIQPAVFTCERMGSRYFGSCPS